MKMDLFRCCFTPAPLWPTFTHSEPICITASFMRFGQCSIHTVKASVNVCVCVRVNVCDPLHTTFWSHYCVLY